MRIERLSAENAGAVIPVYRAMIVENRVLDPRLEELPTDDESLRALMGYFLEGSDDVFLVAIDGSKVIGFLDAVILKRENDERELEIIGSIKSVYLDKAYQDFELLRQLDRVLCDVLKSRKIRAVENRFMIADPQLDLIWLELGYSLGVDRRIKTF